MHSPLNYDHISKNNCDIIFSLSHNKILIQLNYEGEIRMKEIKHTRQNAKKLKKNTQSIKRNKQDYLALIKGIIPPRGCNNDKEEPLSTQLHSLEICEAETNRDAQKANHPQSLWEVSSEREPITQR